ncbi:MAG: hypothetical protein H7Z37_04670 [Pyrinomonadaceae bacterium]|nr:hypothetical protein [Pyrinomonadaceae bacterium]
MVALAAPQETTNGEIALTGKVTVDGRDATNNGTIASGSTITTGETPDSVATISLGKLGSVQVLSQSSIVLKFDQAGIYGTLLNGKVRVMNMVGVTTTISAKQGMVIGDATQANTFFVETECGKLNTNTVAGSTTLRAGGSDKTIAAGGAESNGVAQTGCVPCIRPLPGGAAELPVLTGAGSVGGLGAGALLGILLGVGGAVATGIILGTRGDAGNSVNTSGGGIVVVSPTR